MRKFSRVRRKLRSWVRSPLAGDVAEQRPRTIEMCATQSTVRLSCDEGALSVRRIYMRCRRRRRGSSAIIIVLLLHIAQTILFGSYKGQRHLLWLSGCVLFALMLAMAFTGYLLPWDQKAYFATAVSTNIFVLPVIGPWIKAFVRGGNELGTLTISRFFVAHVFVLPAAIFAFVAMHVYLFRSAGAAGARCGALRRPNRSIHAN